MMEGKEIVKEVEDKKPDRQDELQEIDVDNKCVYFKGFPLDMQDDRIKFMFEQYGIMERISIIEMPGSYKCGFVHYKKHEHAK